VNKVLLEPLAYPQPDRLVELELSGPQGNGDITSIPKFNVWQEQTQAFEAVTAYGGQGPSVNLTGGDRPEQLRGLRASADFFQVFGVPMEMGRPYTREEDVPRGPNLAVLSYGLWRNHFGGDANVVGKTIELSGEPFVVTGVVGPSFRSDLSMDIYRPLQADPNSTDQSHYLSCTARLKPGVTLGIPQAAMKLAAEQFKRKFPGVGMRPQDSFTAVPLRESMVGDARTSLLVLLGAVGFVLLIVVRNLETL
jgi:putative ABC transport system permease protein